MHAGKLVIAISACILAEIVKKSLKIEASLFTILHILSLTFFERVLMGQLLKNMELPMNSTENDNQLNLFLNLRTILTSFMIIINRLYVYPKERHC
jgi:hypothetical protein